jgi:spermidine synthase
MRRLSFGVFLTALSTLILELMLTRAFDVTLAPNISYFVVTVAVFSFGLAGIYATLHPIPAGRDIGQILCTCSILYALMTVLLIPTINLLPLDYTRLGKAPFVTLGSFATLYLALLAPFFLAGYILIAIFSKHALSIQRLYFWDLVGAGIGSVLVVPLIAKIGPGGLIVCAAALALIAAALFSPTRAWTRASLVLAALLLAAPILKAPQYIDFTQHMEKRGVIADLKAGLGEFVRWDPISKINVVREDWTPEKAQSWWPFGSRKAIQYDGGNQTSFFFPFDGDLKSLRARLDRDKSHVKEHFWQLGVLAAHYLKRDSGQSVLIIGSAGGQETKAALVYGAAHVDAVELVPTVVELATGKYSQYIGNIFHNPAVSVQPGEGRSFLRHSNRTYDIIQIYSNFTSSSVAQGTGALAPDYLDTAEAYEEYFSHLTANGVLQINHSTYPRLITTAALAWRRMGRTDFASHVAVYYSESEPMLPTLLFKMQPWTAAEVDDVSAFLAPPELAAYYQLTLVENPVDPSKSFLSKDFYSGDFPAALAARMPFDATPRTDNRPYFGQIRKSLKILAPDPENYVDRGTALQLNASMIKNIIPMDLIHLFVTAVASLIFVILFVFVPLSYSKVGKRQGATPVPLLLYFSCLGAGFIFIELVFIQKFMYLIGSPLYTYSTVIFTMLLSAGIGSASSERLGIGTRHRWAVPFIAIIAIGLLLVEFYPTLVHVALALPVAARIAAAAAMIFPLGFFLGMPFPLGILAIANQPRATIAWAWGMNGLFTVVGGFLSLVLSVKYGFNFALVLALGLYLVAFAVFSKLRDMRKSVVAKAERVGILPVTDDALLDPLTMASTDAGKPPRRRAADSVLPPQFESDVYPVPRQASSSRQKLHQ